MTREQVDCVRPGTLLQINLGGRTHVGTVLEVVEEEDLDDLALAWTWAVDYFVVAWSRPEGVVVTHEPARQLLSELSNVTLLFDEEAQNG